MNVAAMAAVALVVFVEQAVPGGPAIGRVAAGVMLAYGAAVVLEPSLLPTVAA